MTQSQQIAPADAAAAQRLTLAEEFNADLARYTPNLIQALPPDIPAERFNRVLMTAVSSNPDLLYANRRTLFTEAVKCAADGLMPDGREAALVVFATKMKYRDAQGIERERTVEAVKYMPMIYGIRKRMRNSGDVLTASAEVVRRGDTFRYRLGDDPYIEHEPAPLGTDAGEAIGAYAIIRLKNGETLRDVMDRKAIEISHAQSRAKNSLMWRNFPDEAWKKTVLRRCAKAAPQSAENAMLHLIQRDDVDDAALIGAPDEVASLPAPRAAEPHREPANEPVDMRPTFTVNDPLDTEGGGDHVFRSGERARDAILQILEEAARGTLEQLNGAWESNQATVEQMASGGFPDEAVELVQLYDQLRARLKPAPQGGGDPAQQGRPDADVGRPADGGPAPGEASRRGDATEEARSSPQTQVEPGAANDAGNTGEAAHAPAAAESGTVQTERPFDRPFPGDMPAAANAEPEARGEQRDLEITPPVRKGRPDYRTWCVALMGPKVRQQKTAVDLATLIGDNHEHMEAARRSLAGPDARLMGELDQLIDQQYRSIEPG